MRGSVTCIYVALVRVHEEVLVLFLCMCYCAKNSEWIISYMVLCFSAIEEVKTRITVAVLYILRISQTVTANVCFASCI